MRVVIVGAGLAGLTAAADLVVGGHDVVVLDKDATLGGRSATVRHGGATWDQGVQFFTVRSAEFDRRLEPLRRAGHVRVWSHGFGDEPDGFPRFVLRDGMVSLADHLATGVDVRCGQMVFALRAGAGSSTPWSVVIDDGTFLAADAVVLCCPVPQSASLALTADVEMPPDLARTEYARTVSAALAIDRAPAVPGSSGGRPDPCPGLAFASDNVGKGISTRPALTVHATDEWSAQHWDDERSLLAAQLAQLAAPLLGEATVVGTMLRRWRFATPQQIWPEPCWSATGTPGPLVLAGDAFAGPKVEGAVASGAAAARRLLEL